jgi:hypothetical protein
MTVSADLKADAWLESLPVRHAAGMTRSEFLKAIRALSARYVERRGSLPDRSPIDSAGKRAAFAAFYAPLHFLTARLVLRDIGTPADVTSLVDAGCGTGVAGAAWALASSAAPALTGIDLNSWALDEARVTWRTLELGGRASRGDLVAKLDELVARPARGHSTAALGVVLGWSLNELDAATGRRARATIEALASRGARILIIEPIAKSLVPWWDDWAASSSAIGGRADTWRFASALPPFLDALSDEAGFARTELTARTLTFNWKGSC